MMFRSFFEVSAFPWPHRCICLQFVHIYLLLGGLIFFHYWYKYSVHESHPHVSISFLIDLLDWYLAYSELKVNMILQKKAVLLFQCNLIRRCILLSPNPAFHSHNLILSSQMILPKFRLGRSVIVCQRIRTQVRITNAVIIILSFLVVKITSYHS